MEYRGYDSAGIAVINGNGVKIRKAAGKFVSDKTKRRPMIVPVVMEA